MSLYNIPPPLEAWNNEEFVREFTNQGQPESSGAQLPTFDRWLANLFEGETIPLVLVLRRFCEENAILQTSRKAILFLRKVAIAWRLKKKGTAYTAAQLVDFVRNDRVFFVGQTVRLVVGSMTYYGVIGDVDWSQNGVFLEGQTVSFKCRQSDGTFAYSTQGPGAIKPWDGRTNSNPSCANGGGAP